MKNKHTYTYTQSVYGLLAVLSTGPKSGYDIRKRLEAPEMFFWKESYGNIYPMLKLLLKDNLVNQTEAFVKTKKKLIYTINENGQKELNTWLEKPSNLTRYRFELLMKLRFGANLGIQNLLNQLNHYNKANIQQLDEAESIKTIIQSFDDTLDKEIREIIINLFIQRKKTTIDWCNNSMNTLKKREIAKDHGKMNDVYPVNNSIEINNFISLTNKAIPLME